MAEVGITPPATVRFMCDFAEPRLSDPSAKLFEPGCGDGNFLVEILARRLAKIPHHYSDAAFQNQILITITNLYGADISPVAVSETRHRLFALASDFASQHSQPDYRFAPLLEHILERNFIVADLLRNRSKISFPIWKQARDFEFTTTPTFRPAEASA